MKPSNHIEKLGIGVILLGIFSSGYLSYALLFTCEMSLWNLNYCWTVYLLIALFILNSFSLVCLGKSSSIPKKLWIFSMLIAVLSIGLFIFLLGGIDKILADIRQIIRDF